MQKTLLKERPHLGQIIRKSHYLSEDMFPEYIKNLVSKFNDKKTT